MTDETLSPTNCECRYCSSGSKSNAAVSKANKSSSPKKRAPPSSSARATPTPAAAAESKSTKSKEVKSNSKSKTPKEAEGAKSKSKPMPKDDGRYKSSEFVDTDNDEQGEVLGAIGLERSSTSSSPGHEMFRRPYSPSATSRRRNVLLLRGVAERVCECGRGWRGRTSRDL